MRKVEVKIHIKTKPENVIKAFIDRDMLNDWWGVERCLIEPRIGGVYTIAWDVKESGMGYVSTGSIEKYDPSGDLEVSNFVYLNPEKPFLGPMKLTLTARENNGITEVYLCQDGYQNGEVWDWYYEAVKEAWPEVMKSFKKYLESNCP